MNRTLTFDESDHLRHGVLGGNRDQHVHMIGQQMPLLNPAFLLPGQLSKHFPQMFSQLQIQRLATTLRDKHHMVFTLPLAVA